MTRRVRKKAGASPAAFPTAAIEALFASANRAAAPGLVVGVAQHGVRHVRRGYGLASIEHAAANVPSTRMRIASVSKQFTCFGALLLADENRLDPDEPATRLLPELEPLAALHGTPTLRQLMTHASGIRDVGDLHFMSRGISAVRDGALLRWLAHQRGVNFAPGQGQLYSNTGYGLLALAIERASGTTFERWMKERVFEPLGMPDTESVPSDLMIVPRLATMHQALPDGTWRRGIMAGEDHQGAGAMVSTIDDLLTWLGHLRSPPATVGSASAWRQLVERAALANGYETAYALGIIRDRHRGVEILHHGGSLIGVASQLLTVPAHGLDIVLIANCEVHDVVGLSRKIVDLVLGDDVLDAPPPLARTDEFPALPGTRYHARSGMTVGFGDAGGLLGFTIFDSPPIPLLEHRGDSISLGGGGTGPFAFDVAALAAVGARPPESITMMDAGQPVALRRLPDAPPATSVAGARLVGHYDVADLDATARVAFDADGTLALHIDTEQGTRSATLSALSTTVFAVAVRDPVFPARYVLTADAGDAPSFDLDGGRSRHIRFERRDQAAASTPSSREKKSKIRRAT